MPPPSLPQRRKRGRPPLGRATPYPWESWFARPKFILRYGRDFFCAQHAMIQQCRTRASNAGLSIQISEAPGVIVVNVIGKVRS